MDKKRVEENVINLDFKTNKSKKYKNEAIWDSTVYIKKLKTSYLLGFYYFVFLKNCIKKKHLRACISTIIILKTN